MLHQGSRRETLTRLTHLAQRRRSAAALFHYREAIRCEEMAGDRFGAASARFNAALHLRGMGRLSDALSFAESALGGFEACGARGEDLVAKTQVLIEDVRGRQEIREETRGEVGSLLDLDGL